MLPSRSHIHICPQQSMQSFQKRKKCFVAYVNKCVVTAQRLRKKDEVCAMNAVDRWTNADCKFVTCVTATTHRKWKQKGGAKAFKEKIVGKQAVHWNIVIWFEVNLSRSGDAKSFTKATAAWASNECFELSGSPDLRRRLGIATQEHHLGTSPFLWQ